MPRHKRRITIKKCPICNGKHTYQLHLGTTYLFRGKLRKEEADGVWHLTLVLHCPVQDTPFKAEVAVPMKTYLWVCEVDAKPEAHAVGDKEG